MFRCAIGVLLLVVAVGLGGCSPSTSQPANQEIGISISTEGDSQPPSTPLETFLNDASLAVVLRSPEIITQLGLGPYIDVRDDQLSPLSRAYEKETQLLLESLLETLSLYDLSAEQPNTALSAQVYGWHLRELLESHRFGDHQYPVSSHISSYPSAVERVLTRIHPLRSLANAEDYLSRLSQIPARFDELMVRLEDSESIGAVPPSFILHSAADSIQRMANTPLENISYYTVFAERLASIDGIPEVRKEEFIVEISSIIEQSLLPAYGKLASYVSELADRVKDGIGVWRHVDGDAYYAHRLRKYTTTDLSADAIHNLGLSEVDRIQHDLFDAALELGIANADSLTGLLGQIKEETGTVIGRETVHTCQVLIDEIADVVRPAFSSWPTMDIIVVEGQTSAFFSPGALDGSRPGMFYAPAAREEPRFSLPTLTYHEAIPGHGLQTAFAYVSNLPTYRAGLVFSAYAEGWALYAERLAWEMGAYESDPFGNLGRLQAELFRAVRLVVDTGIHAKKWTYDEAVEYMLQNTGLDELYVHQEIQRYIVAPGQATSYKIGMLKFLELRERAEHALGEQFSLPAFHDAVLGEGDVPLLILSDIVDAYILNAR